MAQPRDSHFNHTSPRSSTGGADSFKGTPDTRLTAFSPEDGSAKSSRLLQGFSRSSSATPPVRLPVNSFRGSVSQLDRDPFVSPVHGTRLSPTASAFSPDFQDPKYFPSQNERPVATALSTELGISHYLEISSNGPLETSDVDNCLSELVDKGAKVYGAHELKSDDDGRISAHFFDIRDACWALSALRLAKNGWTVCYANYQVAKNASESPNQRLSQLGQVLILATLAPSSVATASQVTDTAQRILQRCGDLFAFVRQVNYPDGSCRAIAQFCQASNAAIAIRTCNGLATNGIHITVSLPLVRSSDAGDIIEALQDISLAKGPGGLYHQQDRGGQVMPAVNTQPQFPVYPFMIQSPVAPNMPYVLERVPPAGQISAVGPMPPPYPMMRPVYQTPPSPALTVRNDFSPSRPSSGYPRFDSRRQNAARITRSPYHNSASHHNHVDIGRIRDGIDVRTTIMLRNIPNKVDQAMLKRIIDESSWGKYDFMYLRIDFANDCNVGYAFINFVDPLDIIDFVNARGNQRWNCFKSDKVAEISYATIQGKDCLVQKFRNSSVMLEAPHYRPKLFFTSNGPMPELAGQEEAFPEPDNQSKMKRSCENAEHVGLFTPNAGQHFRDEQRRRRSQYDRGTRLAALEEYDYDSTIQHYYGPAAQ
ncbi:RNA recognition motif 2-domain-containing protein [Thelonectria olida]|uniref:RNA recognition motif 2-domain-containing protein n=1 Tax=Thelonectria olida TaxID=1576542 RepID=A0A9P9AS34_9HYPO|nr:RNA recognition motif 2-domain-containing protein [Thelonectria olida]